MSYYLGAYAASPNVTGWDPQLETAYYQQLAKLPLVRGLEHPFVGSLHPHDDAWFLENIAPAWDMVFTTIPGVMNALAKNPQFGLASQHEASRLAAIDFMQQANRAIAKLNQHAGRQVVKAIMLHSAPARHKAASSAAALQQSLTTLLSWDWYGAKLLIEHCDALVPEHAPSKGFLSLASELAVLNALQQTAPPSTLGVVINWGRSVLEARSTSAALEHLLLAKEHGLLRGLMFSGVSDQDNDYGAWKDSHQPARSSAQVAYGAPGSWLTEQAVADCLQLCADTPLSVLGLKIGVRPVTATLAERMQYIDAQLALLARHS